MFGAYRREKSRRAASWPARKWRITGAMVPSGSAMALRPGVAVDRSERWMWQELPSRSLNLAMKVSATPSCAAISLAPVL